MQPKTDVSSNDIGEEEPEELKRFREAWKAEVQSGKARANRQDADQSAVTAQAGPSSVSAGRTPATMAISSARLYSVDEISHELEGLHIGQHVLSRSKISGIIQSFPPTLYFEHEDEQEVSPLKYTPEELILYILRCLDPTSVERFATISRKARVLTLDASIWRDFVVSTYKPPQISSVDNMFEVVNIYSSDYRRLYIEHPRLRLDGVYIAICRYIRPGLGENAWVSINHLITYHRYLRFLPGGQVVSLLASDQTPPQEIIPLLNSSLRMKGFFTGNWELHGTTVYLTSLTDPSGHALRYVFQMTLQLRSKPLGRWNRLEFLSYDSVDLETGEAVPVSLKHEQSPFLFSKVRSYRV